MTTLANPKHLAAMVAVYMSFMKVSTVRLMSGSMPSDATVDSWTSLTSIPSATYKTLATFNVGAFESATPERPFPVVLTLPSNVLSTRSVNPASAGRVGWALLVASSSQFLVVDVGKANSGAVVQIDMLDAVPGTPITLLGAAIKFGD